MRDHSIRSILLPAAAAFLCSTAAAEPVSLPRTSTRSVLAKANGIEYTLYVSLPRDYDASKLRYPVIVLLDAGYSFAIAHNVVEHLADRNHLPWAIIVGIAYAGPDRYRLHRTRDYTPVASPDGGYGPEYQKVSGGGPKFLEFLREELMPMIDRAYRTTEERILVGHSYGGLFASWTLLTSPDLFRGYIVVSPSLWYRDRWLFGVERAESKAGIRVHLSVGGLEGNGRDMQGDLRRLSDLLRETDGIEVRHEVLEGETHNSAFPSAFSRGVRYVLKGR